MYENMNMNMNPATQMTPMTYVRIDGDKIMNLTPGAQGQVLGYTVKAYEDAVSLAEEYEKMLVEHGIIKKEKTPEEAMQDMSQKMDRILSSLENISSRVSVLEDMATEPKEVQS